ncbi:DUF4260 domain-containing protein [Vibrio cholerae]|uniref:DUF4260 domain-containing protein n=1 Tax=Vibrio cholerae TaxID=666 RepID=UPI0039670274
MFVQGKIRNILRLEGLCILLAAVFFYRQIYGDWELFAWLFLVPDLAFLGYLISTGVGTFSYNCTHSMIGAFILLIFSMVVSNEVIMAVSLIWFAHVGFDRALGYGLKYGSSFHDTHLGKIGIKSNT